MAVEMKYDLNLEWPLRIFKFLNEIWSIIKITVDSFKMTVGTKCDHYGWNLI